MIVINLFGGPSSGKSTTAAGLFFQLKIRDVKCELITEYAKDLTYESRHDILADQLYILAKQNRKLERLQSYFERMNEEFKTAKKHDIDCVVTDSPLIMMLTYMPVAYYPGFESVVHQVFNSYNNINFYINRVKPYQTYGRNQTAEEAKLKDVDIRRIISNAGAQCTEIDGDKEAPNRLINILRERKLVVSEPN